MFSNERDKKVCLLMGDIILFYVSALLMLTIRFSPIGENLSAWSTHLKIFSIIFCGWLVIFYIGHLYEIQEIFGRKKLFLTVFGFQAVNFVLAVVFFYIFPDITPKTNLVIISALTAALVFGWRLLFIRIISFSRPIKVLVMGPDSDDADMKELAEKSPGLGYEVFKVIQSSKSLNKPLETFIKTEKIDVVAVSRLVRQEAIHHSLFNVLLAKVEILDLAEFYEMVMKKVKISLVDEQWFLFNLRRLDRQFYDSLKRIIDILLALLGFVCSFWFWPLIALAIKIDSDGPVFHKSWRMGENQKLFLIKKFRTMTVGANGPHWTEKNDKRITKLGKFLRRTHLDEIPQFINVLKGEMSFVGPRPEEKELAGLYGEELPYYHFRHLARPGLIGWAQFNYPHGASVDDAKEKLQYDLYYLKNRSLWLDLSIILRAIRIFITQETR